MNALAGERHLKKRHTYRDETDLFVVNSRLKKPVALTLAKPLPLPRVRRAPRVALDKLRRTKLRST